MVPSVAMERRQLIFRNCSLEGHLWDDWTCPGYSHAPVLLHVADGMAMLETPGVSRKDASRQGTAWPTAAARNVDEELKGFCRCQEFCGPGEPVLEVVSFTQKDVLKLPHFGTGTVQHSAILKAAPCKCTVETWSARNLC